MKAILVPLDGSDLAARAVSFAALLAARGGGEIVLLRAVNTLSAPTERAGMALKREAQESLDSTAAKLEADGLTVTTHVVDRQPESAILEAASDPDVDLIVMSTHGRGGLGRFIYGSVADTVLRHAPVPVLTVPPHGMDAWATDARPTILVPLDGSDLSQAALGPACELADTLGGTLLLGSVVTFPNYASYAEGYVFIDPAATESLVAEMRRYLEEVAARLRTETRAVDVCATYGTPYFGITTMAKDHRVGLIVMATHGRGGVTRALLGSVATATIRQTDVPIVLVRPDEVERDAETIAPTARPVDASASTPESEATTPVVTLTVSPEELGLLTRLVGERLHNERVDPRRAEPTRLLLEKLRTARAAVAASPPRDVAAPSLPAR
jgi:nucleotide-binding universal stress UspA family protein